MEYEKLMDKIAKDAGFEADKIVAEARERAIRIVEEKKGEARRKALEERGDAVQAAEAEARRIIESASYTGRRKAQLAIVQEKEKILDRVFEEVKDRLREFVRTPKYDKFLEAIIRRISIVAGGGELELLIGRQDATKDLQLRKIAEEVTDVTEKNTTLKLSKERLETIGGAMIRTNDRKVIVDSRFESIIDRRRKELEPEIARILFSEGAKLR